MTLSATIGSLSATSIGATPTRPHRRHDFDRNLNQASQATAQAASGSGGGQLLSNDLLQQISALTGQAPSASALTG